MKKLTLAGILIFAFISIGYGSEPLVDIIKFASVEKARTLLSKEDTYTQRWSQFDIDSRMKTKGSSREELFEFMKLQTRAWTNEEKNKIITICSEIDDQIQKQKLELNFPEEIYFVKTTAEEEGGAAGYTRGNYIVLKDDLLSQPESALRKTVIHEFFHILTRNNPEFRKEMYGIIGFHMMNEVAYPQNLKAYRITNPDAPQTDSYISLEVGGESKNCMMILYANQDYVDGDFFKYLNVGFLSLAGDSIKIIEYKDDQPLIYSIKEVSGFFEQVGRNTQYIIHPEEIMAENFVFAILQDKELPNPEIVEEIKKKLRR
jgi:hypothetical protein